MSDSALEIDAARDALSISFGFRVPRSLAALALASERIDLHAALGEYFEISADEWRQPAYRSHAIGYHTWRPEFFLILRPGVDGIGHGLVVHAPELELEELPIFEHDPSGFGPMVFLAPTIPHGLEVVTTHGCGVDDAPLGDAYHALAVALGLAAERVTFDRSKHESTRYVPQTPPGYHFESSSDNIGALAPTSTFMGDELRFSAFLETHGGNAIDAQAAMLAEAGKRLDAGFAGSALLAARRAYTMADHFNIDVAKGFDLWIDAYEALGRPSLARAVRERRTYLHKR